MTDNPEATDSPAYNTDGLDSPAAVDIPTDAALWVRDLAESVSRSFKCPSCGGEFDEWHEPFYGPHPECPFCGVSQGEHDPEGGEE